MMFSSRTLTGYARPALRNSHTPTLSVPMQMLDFDAVMVYFSSICAYPHSNLGEHDRRMDPQPLYLRLANHYRRAIQTGVLAPAQRMPSVRTLVRTHHVSLSTALQACRQLEDDGLIEARPRSGYFVLHLSLIHI